MMQRAGAKDKSSRDAECQMEHPEKRFKAATKGSVFAFESDFARGATMAAPRMLPATMSAATSAAPLAYHHQMPSKQPQAHGAPMLFGDRFHGISGPDDWIPMTSHQSMRQRPSIANETTGTGNASTPFFQVPNRCGTMQIVARDWQERSAGRALTCQPATTMPTANNTTGTDNGYAIVARSNAYSLMTEPIDLRSHLLSQMSRSVSATPFKAVATVPIPSSVEWLVGRPAMRDCPLSATMALPAPTNNTANWSVLPICLSSQADELVLSPFQIYLRRHIEVFAADRHDVYSSVRGRTKAVLLHQVGLRCRHCAHVAPSHRTKGSTYYPSSTLGLYQAAQNMSSTHLQTGACPEMPDSIQQCFTDLLSTKRPGSSSMSGRKYWSDQAQKMGLVDTERGIFSRLHL